MPLTTVVDTTGRVFEAYLPKQRKETQSEPKSAKKPKQPIVENGEKVSKKRAKKAPHNTPVEELVEIIQNAKSLTLEERTKIYKKLNQEKKQKSKWISTLESLMTTPQQRADNEITMAAASMAKYRGKKPSQDDPNSARLMEGLKSGAEERFRNALEILSKLTKQEQDQFWESTQKRNKGVKTVEELVTLTEEKRVKKAKLAAETASAAPAVETVSVPVANVQESVVEPAPAPIAAEDMQVETPVAEQTI